MAGSKGPARLGLLGGTFDPVHVGHLAAADAAYEQLGLDRVLLVVANCPWQKVPTRHISPAADRLAMVRAACKDRPELEPSSLEIDRGGPSYTIDTVSWLCEDAVGSGEPAPELFLVVGADLVPTLSTWRRADRLAELVTLAVVPRPHLESPEVPRGWRWCVVHGVDVDVSSSEVRERVAQGRSVRGLVPDSVIGCIERRVLYAGGK